MLALLLLTMLRHTQNAKNTWKNETSFFAFRYKEEMSVALCNQITLSFSDLFMLQAACEDREDT